MVHFYNHIPPSLSEWALQQQVFFIASAPLTGSHINLSPKGLPASTLHIFDPNHIAYIDATGSGIETVSHVYENGRVTVMFCSFDKGPRIMRWFCTGRVVECEDEDGEGGEFGALVEKMGRKGLVQGARAVLLLEVWKCQTSCGYAVPVVKLDLKGEGTMKKGGGGQGEGSKIADEGAAAEEAGDEQEEEWGPRAYMADRKTLGHWAGNQIEKGTLLEYRRKMNTRSLDGCSGLKVARRQKGEWILVEDAKIWARRTLRQTGAMTLGAVLMLVVLVLIRVAVDAGGGCVLDKVRLLF